MIQPWKKTASRSLGFHRVFHLRMDTSVSPRTGEAHDFVVLECPGWVNVVATTPDDQVILVEQFRHGSETVELEIPGGVMDPHDDSPVAAGVRELREETGYEGDSPRLIGSVLANPAIQNNECHTVLVQNCRLTHPTQLDAGEDLRVRLIPATDLPRLMAEGAFRHSLVVVALAHYDLWRRGLKR